MESMRNNEESSCMHQHNDFKQEIEDSIRRCEELLSMAPMSYQPPDGKGSGRKSSRSTPSCRRSDGRSDADTVSSSMESERKSADVDPEWKKNMGLLMNRQDGTSPGYVSPRLTPRASPSRPRDEIPYLRETHEHDHRDEHRGPEQPLQDVEEYNFSFDESPNSSCLGNLAQGPRISIRMRDKNDEPSSESEDHWAYDRLRDDGGASVSTKTSRSELNSKAESDRPLNRRGFNEPLELELDTFDDNEMYPRAREGQIMQSDHAVQQNARVAELEEACGTGAQRDQEARSPKLSEPSNAEFLVKTSRSVDGDYEVLTTERTATFPRSCRSSRSSHPARSPARSPPPGSPTGSGSNRPSSSNFKNSPAKRINENSMSFSFTIPSQPKYAEDWEWFEECAGAEPKFLVEAAERERIRIEAKGPIVLENGRMRIGEAKLVKTDTKRFKVHKKFRSQRDANNSIKSKAGKSPNRMGARQVPVLGEKQTGHIPARLRHLSKPRTDLYQKFAHTRAQLEEEHMSECSFRPKVGRRPNPHSQYSAPLIQRVGGIEQRLDLRKRARKVIEKEEIDQCSFWPKINSNSEYLDQAHYKPIEERAMEYQRRREAKLARARAKEDMEMGLTFRPEINPKSVKIFKQTGLEVVNVEDRLTNPPPMHQERKPKDMPKNECTFTPEINRNTDLIMRASKLFEGCTPDFLSRQKYCMQVRDMKQRAKEQQIWLETATFKPKTGNSDAILKDSQIADVFDQSIYDRVDRLYHRDPEQRQHIRQKISDAYYAQFSHQPEIDETSRLLGRPATSYDLYKNERGNKVKEQIKTSLEQIFAKEHPFQPKIARPRSSERNKEQRKLVAQSPRRPSAERMENVLHRRRQFRLEKARVLEEMKVIRELQEFKECTFKPIVNPLPPKDKEPVVVKGLGRHLELQDLAKQMKKDQEEWERKIFFQHVYALPRRQYTIPKPFTLCAGRTKPKNNNPPDNRPSCVVQFNFEDRNDYKFPKKGPRCNSFYEASHPTPANPKWKDNTIWSTPAEAPRFNNGLKELAFRS